MKKTESALKKIANLELKAYNQGKKNFRSGTSEALAESRATICKECPHNEIEPIEELAVADPIASISNRCCGVCGCTLSYLLRQTVKDCAINKWGNG